MKAVVIFAFLYLFTYCEAVNVTCEFGTSKYWDVLRMVYTCKVTNSLNIQTREEAVIESASPSPSQTVKIFWAEQKIIHFFPRNLENFFPSLEGIAIDMCNLKEVNKDDLKPFTQLRYISFYDNDIKVIEQDLFFYNPNLEYVAFHYNKITHIDPNVFDHLGKLSWLWLGGNTCDIYNIPNDVRAVKSYIAELKTKCKDPKYTSTSTTELETMQTNMTTDNETIVATTSGAARHENIFLNYLFTFFTFFFVL